MTKLKIVLAMVAMAFLTVSPLGAAEIPAPVAPAPKAPAAPEVPSVAKPDPAAALKQKAADVVEKSKSGIDEKAKDLKKALDAKKDAAKTEALDVNRETVTIETPQGAAQETVITVTPETPAAPSMPAPASK